MKKKFCTVFILLCLLGNSFSQNWQNVGQGFDIQTRYFWNDTAANLLYCTGGFQHVENIPVNACAQWDGNSWDSIPNINYYGAMEIVRFNGDLYIAGYSHYILHWNGIQIDTIGNTYYGAVLKMYVFNNELYAIGGFDSINGLIVSDVAKYNGSAWSAIDTTHWIGGAMYNATFYQGNLYVSGNMTSSDGTIRSLAYWDGTQWHSVSNNALYNGLGGVSCFAIYNNDLWIGGFFFQSMGNPYDCIARWNGSQFLDPGGGTNYPGQPFAMKVFNNELWMVGNFSTVAGIQSQCVSKWNGTDWCSIGDTFSAAGVSDITVYDNELYICGGFKTINSDTFNFIAKWIGGNYSDSCANTTGINEQTQQNFSVNVFPNPVSENATFQFQGLDGNKTIIIYDQLGKEIWRKETNESQIEFLAEDFSAGLYFYRVEQSGEIKTRGKFIIE